MKPYVVFLNYMHYKAVVTGIPEFVNAAMLYETLTTYGEGEIANALKFIKEVILQLKWKDITDSGICPHCVISGVCRNCIWAGYNLFCGDPLSTYRKFVDYSDKEAIVEHCNIKRMLSILNNIA